jgi:hypothetical protein
MGNAGRFERFAEIAAPLLEVPTRHTAFAPESLEAEIRAAGLTIEAILANLAGDDYDPDADELAVIAGKPR